VAITTFAQVISGLQAPVWIAKGGTGPGVPVWGSTWGVAGSPVAGAYSGSIAGSVLTSPLTGALPWNDPVSGNAYLARFQIASQSPTASTSPSLFILADRLWHNGAIDITGASSPQTVNSATWPARDINGNTTGVGVLLGVEVSGATGAGTPTLTASYTNTSGTAGQSAVNIYPTVATTAVNSFHPLSLVAGDIGVQSVQSFSLSGTWTSGTINLVAYRPIAILDGLQNRTTAIDAVTGAMPRLYAGSVLWVLMKPAVSNGNSPCIGEVQFTWG